jgi:hypothetical protein
VSPLRVACLSSGALNLMRRARAPLAHPFGRRCIRKRSQSPATATCKIHVISTTFTARFMHVRVVDALLLELVTVPLDHVNG